MHDAYQLVKFLHLFAAVLWLGWSLLAPFWLGAGLACPDAGLLAQQRKRSTWLAVLCVGGGGALAWITGWPMARTLAPDAFGMYWLRTSMVLFLMVSVVWLAALLPAYRRLLTLREETGTTPRGPALAWRIMAVATGFMGVVVLWLMTVRPL